MTGDISQIIMKLHEIEAVKFGAFKLKSGIISPIYIDLRLIISHPELLKQVAEAIWSKVNSLSFDLLCGVPYTALPIATAISLNHRRPMVMRRKEAKEHGTRKMIEGSFKQGQRCLVIEDLVTSGASILETIEPLKMEGIAVKDVAVLIDREQGGRKYLAEQGYDLHSVFTISDLLKTLEKNGKMTSAQAADVQNFLRQNQTRS